MKERTESSRSLNPQDWTTGRLEQDQLCGCETLKGPEFGLLLCCCVLKFSVIFE